MNPLSTTSGARLKKAAPPAPEAKPTVETVTHAQLLGMKDLNGIFLDPATGKAYKEDGTYTGFTFESYPTWSGPFGLQFNWPFLNPISFATEETANKVAAVVKNWLQNLPIGFHGWEVVMDDKQRVTGPFTRTVERLIVVSRFPVSEQFSAGMLANSLMRNPEESARVSFLAELRTAGFSGV